MSLNENTVRVYQQTVTSFISGNRIIQVPWNILFYRSLFCSLSTNPKVKELLKSVHICQSYRSYRSYRKNKNSTLLSLTVHNSVVVNPVSLGHV